MDNHQYDVQTYEQKSNLSTIYNITRNIYAKDINYYIVRDYVHKSNFRLISYNIRMNWNIHHHVVQTYVQTSNLSVILHYIYIYIYTMDIQHRNVKTYAHKSNISMISYKIYIGNTPS